MLEDIYVVKYQLTSLASFKFRGLGEDMVSDDPEAVTLAGALVIQPSEGRNLCLLVYEGDPTAVVDHYSFIPPRVLTEVMGAVFFWREGLTSFNLTLRGVWIWNRDKCGE